ncbi:MAG TPA: hypothetical protein DEA08_04125 [Planctomycetes bacterium]|nr:hypothetical protein [Planctomycetota bacterium]
MNRAHHLLFALALLLLSGCTGTYAGGPLDDDEPHAIVRPGVDVTIWAVDGQPTSTHSFSVMVAPGRRVLTLRVEHSMEDETPKPHSRQRYVLQTEDGVAYHLERRDGSIGEIDVTTSRFR